MRDMIFDRDYQAARSDLNDGLEASFARVGRMLRTTAEVLNRIQFSAPWRIKEDRTGIA